MNFQSNSNHYSTVNQQFQPTLQQLPQMDTRKKRKHKKKNENMVVHKVIRGLKPGVYYQFWVSAVNALNNEGPTSMVQGYRHERRRNIELEASRGKLRSLENVSLT